MPLGPLAILLFFAPLAALAALCMLLLARDLRHN